MGVQDRVLLLDLDAYGSDSESRRGLDLLVGVLRERGEVLTGLIVCRVEDGVPVEYWHDDMTPHGFDCETEGEYPRLYYTLSRAKAARSRIANKWSGVWCVAWWLACRLRWYRELDERERRDESFGRFIDGDGI